MVWLLASSGIFHIGSFFCTEVEQRGLYISAEDLHPPTRQRISKTAILARSFCGMASMAQTLMVMRSPKKRIIRAANRVDVVHVSGGLTTADAVRAGGEILADVDAPPVTVSSTRSGRTLVSWTHAHSRRSGGRAARIAPPAHRGQPATLAHTRQARGHILPRGEREGLDAQRVDVEAVGLLGRDQLEDVTHQHGDRLEDVGQAHVEAGQVEGRV